MPIIGPPTDNDYSSIEEKESSDGEKIELDWWDNKRRIELFLNVQPWLCPQCGIKNFGRNQRCANFKCKIERPANHELHRRS